MKAKFVEGKLNEFDLINLQIMSSSSSDAIVSSKLRLLSAVHRGRFKEAAGIAEEVIAGLGEGGGGGERAMMEEMKG